MFTVPELATCLSEPWFKEGYRSFERSLIRARLGLGLDPTLQVNQRQLARFSQAVLASVGRWENPRGNDARELCVAAGDIEAAFSTFAGFDNQEQHRRLHLLNAAILYDIAGMPGTSASYAARDGLADDVKSFFSRSPESSWGLLSTQQVIEPQVREALHTVDIVQVDDLLNTAVGDVVGEFGRYLQAPDLGTPTNGLDAIRSLTNIVASYSLRLDGDVIQALLTALNIRRSNSVIETVKPLSNIDQPTLRSIRIPAEVWPAQKAALQGGLLDQQFVSFGVASPTGTGKTALTRLLLADFFKNHPDRKALYISPSRALTGQIARDLSRSLAPLGVTVTALGAALTVGENLGALPKDADLMVFTPEKADLLLRVEPDIFGHAGLGVCLSNRLDCGLEELAVPVAVKV